MGATTSSACHCESEDSCFKCDHFEVAPNQGNIYDAEAAVVHPPYRDRVQALPVMSDQAGYAEDTDKTLEPAKRGLSTNSDLRPMFLGPGGNDSLPDCRLSMHDLGGEWYSLDGCRVGRVDGGYMHWDPSYNFAPTPFEIVQDIPIDDQQVDLAVDKVQMLVLKTYSFIRAQVCDQVELMSESFFKLPMLRRLEENMALLELTETDKGHWEARRHRLGNDIGVAQQSLVEINACIDRLKSFKAKCDARSAVA